MPYTAAFFDRPPPLPSTSTDAEHYSRQIVIAHWVLDAFVFPPGRVAVVDEQAEAEQDHGRAERLATADVLPVRK